MSRLTEILEEVKEENLSLEKIEKLRDEMVHLHSMMQISLAEIEKAEAFFIDTFDQDETDAARKRKWRVTEQGQRQIEINRFLKVVVKEIDSLRSRVYRLI